MKEGLRVWGEALSHLKLISRVSKPENACGPKKREGLTPRGEKGEREYPQKGNEWAGQKMHQQKHGCGSKNRHGVGGLPRRP